MRTNASEREVELRRGTSRREIESSVPGRRLQIRPGHGRRPQSPVPGGLLVGRPLPQFSTLSSLWFHP
ncbi:MAG: hypothetical protein ACI82F_003111 [Planctomycetota bacterium]|jgi:hypothetical protein